MGTIANIMRESGLVAVQPREFLTTTVTDPDAGISDEWQGRLDIDITGGID